MFLKFNVNGWCLSIFLLISLFGSCRSPDDEMIEATWEKNASTIEGAVKNGEFSGEEYWRSLIFFQQLTGIRISSNLGHDGAMPDANTERDLKRVRQWYRKNRDKLCWNRKKGSVELCVQEAGAKKSG